MISGTAADSSSRSVLFESLPSISLAGLDEIAALAERKDRKYMLAPETLETVISQLDHGFAVLADRGRRSFGYESVYFDTPGLDDYLRSARSRPRRHKIRTRSYLDRAVSNFEIKARSRRGLTVKHRLPIPFASRGHLSDEARVFMATHTDLASMIDHYRPTLTVAYQRSTLVERSSRSRITIDAGLSAVDFRGRVVPPLRLIVVETKSLGRPTRLDRLLWSNHIRPVSFSKYCTLMAVLDPTLTSNKWHRVLQQMSDGG